MTKKQKLIFAAIVAIAIFFRFYLITQIPGGLFPDEAANGLDINLMQQGHLQPFYERGNGREALFFYLEWASVAVFGKGAWQHHIVSASIGVASVVVIYLVTYRLMLIGGKFEDDLESNEEEKNKRRTRAIRVALLAMFLMAVSYWHVTLSRTAFRATMIPLVSGLTIYFLLCAYQSVTTKTRLWYSFLCGAMFALGFYTYIAFRIMVPFMFVVLLWPLFGSLRDHQLKERIKKYFLPFVLFVIAFLIVIFPIARYFYTHPGSFIGRSGQVSVFNQNQYLVNGVQLASRPPLKTVLAVTWTVTEKSVLAYFAQGDLNWRQNVSGFPFLSVLVSPFFGLGLIVATFFALWYFFAPGKRSYYWKYYMVAVWFYGMLLAEVTTAEGIPHGLRSIGTLMPAYIIATVTLYWCVEWVLKLHEQLWTCACGEYHCDVQPYTWWKVWRKSLVDNALKLVAVLFFVALILQSYFLYFVYTYNSPESFYAFRSDLTPVSQYLVDHCNQALTTTGKSTKNTTYLILDKFSVQTTDYFTSDWHGNFNAPCNVPYVQVDPERSFLPAGAVYDGQPVWPNGIRSGDQMVFTQSTIFDITKFKQSYPNAFLKEEIRNKFGQAVMAAYQIK